MQRHEPPKDMDRHRPMNKESTVVLYAGSQRYVRTQNVHEGVELPHKELRIP